MPLETLGNFIPGLKGYFIVEDNGWHWIRNKNGPVPPILNYRFPDWAKASQALIRYHNKKGKHYGRTD